MLPSVNGSLKCQTMKSVTKDKSRINAKSREKTKKGEKGSEGETLIERPTEIKIDAYRKRKLDKRWLRTTTVTATAKQQQ